MSQSHLIKLRKIFRVPLLTALMLMWSGGASAVLLSPDLAITGSVELSTTIGVAPFSDGAVVQSGTISTTEGGSTTTGNFSTTAGTADGTNDGTTTVPTTNPLTGTFTNTGDGVGYSTDLDAGFATGFNFNEGYDFIVDFGMDLANASATDTYTITMQVDYSNIVDVAGNDAFADSRLDLELTQLMATVDVFSSEVLSDSLLSLNGDELNGVLLGTYGEQVSHSGSFFFDVILAPGAMAMIGGIHQWEGGVFEAGSSLADIGVDLTIASVVCDGECAAVVPLPGAAWLFISGLSGLALFWRRRSHNLRVVV